MFFFKSYVASYGYVRRPGTERIPEGVKKKLRRNRNPDSCGKGATGTEKTGIRRIPAGIGNLVCHTATNISCYHPSVNTRRVIYYTMCTLHTTIHHQR
jgi:hypothetical protein